ncbi:MAG: hypothetical protein KF886_22425 [Candidatus Hydrogenedentes bacterium]|nr:hypothetical protein [Candidatus Hydrogenedentota bacterium]
MVKGHTMPPGFISAPPAAGWGFKEWTGAAGGVSASVNVTMDEDKSVNAVFYQTTLTVTKSGEGQVTQQFAESLVQSYSLELVRVMRKFGGAYAAEQMGAPFHPFEESVMGGAVAGPPGETGKSGFPG